MIILGHFILSIWFNKAKCILLATFVWLFDAREFRSYDLAKSLRKTRFYVSDKCNIITQKTSIWNDLSVCE